VDSGGERVKKMKGREKGRAKKAFLIIG